MSMLTNNLALSALPPELQSIFLPLRKRAMGGAVGLTIGLTLLLVNVYHLLFDPEHVTHLWLLRNFFAGYNPENFLGALVGFLWAFLVGFILGWMIAAFRNFSAAVCLEYLHASRVRARRKTNPLEQE